MGSIFLVLTPKSAAPPSGVVSSSGHQQHLRSEQEKFSQILTSTNQELSETYTHPQFAQKLNEISLSPQTYRENLAPSFMSHLTSFTL